MKAIVYAKGGGEVKFENVEKVTVFNNQINIVLGVDVPDVYFATETHLISVYPD